MLLFILLIFSTLVDQSSSYGELSASKDRDDNKLSASEDRDDNKLSASKDRDDELEQSRKEEKYAVDKWNAKYCKTKGCKLATTVSLNLLSSGDTAAPPELIERNEMLDPLYNLPIDMKPLSFNRTVPYLGVVLDAGRHYYPIDWIRNLLQIMHAMGYNLLHFRLTNDQAFNVELESMPQLAHPAPDSSGGRVYTASELKELVSYADTLNIVIMPEVNLPGHAGGWAGNHTPNLLIPCARFICQRGSGLPLNLTHPKLKDIVRSVLREVIEIFHTTPYLHLGGDQLHMSESCFREVKKSDYAKDYQAFETFLLDLIYTDLKRVEVVRWEATYQTRVKGSIGEVNRTGDITHYWHSNDHQERPTKEVAQAFCSQGLDSHTSRQLAAFPIFKATRDMIEPTKPQPLAVIVGTFDLGTEQWMDRNVIGRLLGVALGVSDQQLDDSQFSAIYSGLCRDQLHLDSKLCDREGVPIISQFLYSLERQDVKRDEQEMLCQRLTEQEHQLELTNRDWAKRLIVTHAMSNFWNHFAEDPPEFASAPLQAKPINETYKDLDFLRNDQQSQSQFRGIVLDLVRIELQGDSMSRILSTLNLMHLLGLNTLQLRIMNDVGFVVEIPQHRDLIWGTRDPYTEDSIRTIVKHAQSLGIQVIPEITTATRAGGWFAAGVLAGCPKIMCGKGSGMGANATDTDFIAILVSVLHQLLEQFDHPPYIHIGFDEREEVKACYDEAKLEVDLVEFERRLVEALKFQDFDESKLIRWENSEGIIYPGRAGHLTHYRLSKPISSAEPFFISSGLNLGDPSMTDMDAWSVYKHTRKLVSYDPTGILAEVDLVHEAFWKDFAVVQRLVAFAIGLSSPDLSESDFQEHLVKSLAVLKMEENQAGKILDAEIAIKHLQKHWDLRTNESCQRRVSHFVKTMPKEGVLVEKSADKAVS